MCTVCLLACNGFLLLTILGVLTMILLGLQPSTTTTGGCKWVSYVLVFAPHGEYIAS